MEKKKLDFGNAKTVAEYEVVAEPKKAKEKAEQETRKALDLLRYAIHWFGYPGLKIGLSGELIGGKHNTLVFSSKDIIIDVEIVEQYCDISEKNLKIMYDIGLFELSEILKKQETERTSFEKTLLQAVHWFSSSQNQLKIENEFLNLISCLESLLLSGDKKEPITRNLSLLTSILLENDEAKRHGICNRIQELYGKRSRLTHGGTKSLIKKNDCKYLLYVAGNLIRRFTGLIDEYDDKKQYIDKMKKEIQNIIFREYKNNIW
ncbi:MAG: hypothetical protein K8T10_21140 [Candidatus Eremiobacteraeota bacterium]|nr:hypothetical protein [Candidatus Eremiobacteraeota bacterium]